MEKWIDIRSVKFIPTKSGKDRWIVENAGGNPDQLSVWDKSLSEDLASHIGTVKLCNVTEKNGYYNIQGVDEQAQQDTMPQSRQVSAIVNSGRNPAQVGNVMNCATELYKHAIPADTDKVDPARFMAIAKELLDISDALSK